MHSDNRRTPRQKRSKEKVDRILDAVEQLTTELGPQSVTTTHIAEKTGFAVGTVYQYFGNRTELQAAAEERMFERLTRQLDQDAGKVTGGPIEKSVDRLIGVYVDSARAQRGYIPLLINPPGVNETVIQEKLGPLITALIRMEYPDVSDRQLTVTLKTVVSILAILTDVVVLEPDPELQARYQDELVAQCLYALKRAGDQAADTR